MILVCYQLNDLFRFMTEINQIAYLLSKIRTRQINTNNGLLFRVFLKISRQQKPLATIEYLYSNFQFVWLNTSPRKREVIIPRRIIKETFTQRFICATYKSNERANGIDFVGLRILIVKCLFTLTVT